MGDGGDLTFERLGERIFGNKNWGYWVVGLLLITAWCSTGFAGVIIYGKQMYGSFLVYLTLVPLSLFTLWGLRYIRKIFYTTLEEYKLQLNKHTYENAYYNLIDKKSWWTVFALMFLYLILWFLFEYSYIKEHPDVVGTGIYRGANMGVHLLVYETIVSIFLFIIFVDLIVIISRIARFPFEIKDQVKIDILATDKCGGLSKIGSMILAYTKVYFILITWGTLFRFPGAIFPNYPYSITFYLIVTGIAWMIGVLIFIIPQYPLHKQMQKLKNMELKEINQNLRNVIHSREELKILASFRIKEEIENLKEYPLDYSTFLEFISFTLLPVFTNIFNMFVTKYLLARG